jgi:hypothetical protein
MTDRTAAARQAKQRQRRKEAGEVLIQVWVPADKAEAVRAAIEALAQPSLLSRSPDVVSKGGHVGWALKEWDTAGSESSEGTPPPADDQPEAQGREAGPGGWHMRR